MRRRLPRLMLAGMAVMIAAAGCNGGSALAPQYQPQVSNTPNVKFSFQATGIQQVSDALTYSWNVSSGQVVIHPATNTTSGTVSLTLKDAAGTVIYSGTIPPSGDITPPAGAPGPWQVGVVLTDYTGTINFAVQMM